MEKEKKENRRSAAEELTRYLAPRMRTVAEARKHLEEKLYDESEIRETLQRFLDLKYLDDSDYVRAYCEYAFGKRRGSTRIRSELRNKGIESESGTPFGAEIRGPRCQKTGADGIRFIGDHPDSGRNQGVKT